MGRRLYNVRITLNRNARYGIEINDHCLDCKWRSDSYFCQFDPKVLKQFDAISYANIYPAGTVLYAENEPPRGLFIVCTGQVKLSISSGSGKTLITRMVPAGEVLGLSSVLSGKPYRQTAETAAPSQLKFVKREDFLQFSEEHRDISFNIARQLIEECESDANQIRALGLANSAAERLAQLLLQWCEDSGQPFRERHAFPGGDDARGDLPAHRHVARDGHAPAEELPREEDPDGAAVVDDAAQEVGSRRPAGSVGVRAVCDERHKPHGHLPQLLGPTVLSDFPL